MSDTPLDDAQFELNLAIEFRDYDRAERMERIKSALQVCDGSRATIERLTKERDEARVENEQLAKDLAQARLAKVRMDEDLCFAESRLEAANDAVRISLFNIEAAYDAAKQSMPPEALSEIGAGELERVVRAVLLTVKSRADSLAAELAQAKQERDEWQMQAASLQSQIAGDVERQSERNYWAGQKAELAKVREALAPSGETKAAYMGEFSFDRQYMNDAGNEMTETITVPWTTIKEIMKAISARASMSTTPVEQNDELAKAREALSAIRDLPETKPTLEARHYWHQAQTIARAALPATPEPQTCEICNGTGEDQRTRRSLHKQPCPVCSTPEPQPTKEN